MHAITIGGNGKIEFFAGVETVERVDDSHFRIGDEDGVPAEAVICLPR